MATNQELSLKLAERTRSVILYAIETYRRQEKAIKDHSSTRKLDGQRFLLSLSDNLAELKDRDRKSEELYLGYKPTPSTASQSVVDLGHTDDVSEVNITITARYSTCC